MQLRVSNSSVAFQYASPKERQANCYRSFFEAVFDRPEQERKIFATHKLPVHRSILNFNKPLRSSRLHFPADVPFFQFPERSLLPTRWLSATTCTREHMSVGVLFPLRRCGFFKSIIVMSMEEKTSSKRGILQNDGRTLLCF